MDEAELQDLIRKFRAEKITDGELARLKQFLERPESEALLQKMDFSSLPLKDKEFQIDQRAVYSRILHLLGLKVFRLRRTAYVAAACAAAVLVSVGGWLAFTRSNDHRRNEVATWNHAGTGKGQVRRIKLPDGTVVYLGAASRLDYPAAFRGDSTRSIYLDGEAFFEVAHDPKPFIVQTAHSDTRVLGTHFNVEAYSNEATTRISLLEGKVLTGRGNDQAILRPGDMMELDNLRPQHSIRPIAINAVSWHPGDLVLDEMPLRLALERVSNFYGIDVRADTAIIRSYTITGAFGHDEPERALSDLLGLYGLKWKKVKDQYLVYQ